MLAVDGAAGGYDGGVQVQVQGGVLGHCVG